MNDLSIQSDLPKQKILILIPQMGTVMRGGESSVLGLARFLQSRYEVTVLGARKTQYLPWQFVPFLEPSNWATLSFRDLPDFLRRLLFRIHIDPEEYQKLRFCIRAFSLILRYRPDLLLVRSVGFWGDVLGRLLRWLDGIPFISIPGDWTMSEYECARLKPDAHICVNPDVADYLKERLPDVRVEYLPNGLDVGNFRQEVSQITLNLERPIFLTAGAIIPCKRYHLAIRAVAGLERGSLLILGKGDQGLAEELQNLGESLLGPRRFLLESVPYAQMASYYAFCDVFTLPSDSIESFGMVYIEAMAHNKPVVATRDRNRKIIVGDGGQLCDPEDIPAYAAALDRVWRMDFGDRPRRQAEQFDWSVIGPKYAKVIEDILSRGVDA